MPRTLLTDMRSLLEMPDREIVAKVYGLETRMGKVMDAIEGFHKALQDVSKLTPRLGKSVAASEALLAAARATIFELEGVTEVLGD